MSDDSVRSATLRCGVRYLPRGGSRGLTGSGAACSAATAREICFKYPIGNFVPLELGRKVNLAGVGLEGGFKSLTED